MKTNQAVEFGDRVKDIVSGFTGIAIGYTKWMTGCGRWIIQPEAKKDGALPECQSLDEAHIVVVKKGVVKPNPVYRVDPTLLQPKKMARKKKTPPGGPHPTPKQYPA